MDDKHASGAFYAAQLKGEALEPCPFCNRKSRLHEMPNNPGWWKVKCLKRGCRAMLKSVNDPKKAIRLWNTRALIAAKVIKE